MAEQTKIDLVKSDDFENALEEGAEFKTNIVTSYKMQNKDNYDRFYEIMMTNDEHIQEILNKKKKNRTEAELEELKTYKKTMSAMYKQTQDLIVKEEVEEGKKTKIEKIVAKVIPVVKMLRYIGNDILEKEFAKNGVTLNFSTLESENVKMNEDNIRNSISDVFSVAKNVKEKVNDDTAKITEDIFVNKVPIELQFDKDTNPSGMKATDFKKLVDIKTSMTLAKSEDAKEKLGDKIEKMASDKQFEAARAELMRDTLTDMQ